MIRLSLRTIDPKSDFTKEMADYSGVDGIKWKPSSIVLAKEGARRLLSGSSCCRAIESLLKNKRDNGCIKDVRRDSEDN